MTIRIPGFSQQFLAFPGLVNVADRGLPGSVRRHVPGRN